MSSLRGYRSSPIDSGIERLCTIVKAVTLPPSTNLHCRHFYHQRFLSSPKRNVLLRKVVLSAYCLLCFRVGWLEFDHTEISLMPP